MLPVSIVCLECSYLGLQDYYDMLALQFNYQLIIINEKKLEEMVIDNDHGIYIFFQLIPKYLIKANNFKNIYIINTEQLSTAGWLSIIQKYLKLGLTIFDYDLYQSKMTLSDRHIYLPYLYDDREGLMTLIQNTTKIYDVAICCINNSPRRQKIYDKLKEKNINVINVKGWKMARDKQLAQTKILLNIHYHENYKIFEHMRCDRWILSGLLVVSETSLSDPSLDIKDHVIIEPYSNLVDKVIDILNNYDLYYQRYQLGLQKNKQNIINQRLNELENFKNKLLPL